MPKILLEKEAFNLLRKYKIPTADYKVVSSEGQLEALKFPAVLKAISPRIIHKTEAGAIKIVNNLIEAKAAFKKLKSLGQVLAQDFVKGRETIIGIKYDQTFGPCIMFGLGGVLVEVLHDVSFRVCPITTHDAQQMIKEIKSYAVLKGVRGAKSINFKVLENTLLKVSQLALKEKISELDINPFIVNDRQGFAVDVRIMK